MRITALVSLAFGLIFATGCDVGMGGTGGFGCTATSPYGELCPAYGVDPEDPMTSRGQLILVVEPNTSATMASVMLRTDDGVEDTIDIYPDMLGHFTVASNNVPPDGWAEFRVDITTPSGDTLPLFCDDLQLSTQTTWANGWPIFNDQRSSGSQGCLLRVTLDRVINTGS